MATDRVLVGDDMPAEAPVEEEVQEAPVEEEAQEAPVEEAALLGGKFKSVADLEKSYSEPSSKLGEQGNRLGKAEEERSLLLRQLDSLQAQSQVAPKDEDKAAGFEEQLGQIAQQVEDGDLSIGEGMHQTAKVSALIAQNETVKGIRQEQEQSAFNQSKQNFADANPDFFEMQQAGVLEAAKGKLPGFHDDVSAFYALKAEQALSSVEAARAEGVALGKAEMAKIAGGDSNTQKVLQGGGNSAEKIGRKQGPMKQNEIRESGLAALQRARGG